MLELNPQNVVGYLRERGKITLHGAAVAEPLAWGVSNVVLRVNCSDGPDLVIKQSREKLRTRADWRSRLERIYREAEVQRLLADRLLVDVVPRVLFEDRPNYLFAMQAVEADHTVWKSSLLNGDCDRRVATTAGDALSLIHNRTAGDDALRSAWSDVTVFDELRLDPFYRFTANVHPHLAGRLDDLISETRTTQVCLVLGDFSPKNILITRRGIALVDFETGHFGDPAFDLGFFLSHLLLKEIASPSLRSGTLRGRFLELAEAFWWQYLDRLDPPRNAAALQPPELSRRTVPHLAGCLLARIDGKSPVDYLNDGQQQIARQFALWLFAESPPRTEDAFDQLRQTLPR